MHGNPIHESILKHVIKPELDKLVFEANGVILGVDYIAQTAEVKWVDQHNVFRTSYDVPLPKDADGVYRQSAQIGQKVKLGFVNGVHTQPYISIVYRHDASRSDYQSKGGASIPKGINYGIWG